MLAVAISQMTDCFPFNINIVEVPTVSYHTCLIKCIIKKYTVVQLNQHGYDL